MTSKKTNQHDKKRRKDIIRMRRNRYKLREIAEKYGITKQRVYQILKGI